MYAALSVEVVAILTCYYPHHFAPFYQRDDSEANATLFLPPRSGGPPVPTTSMIWARTGRVRPHLAIFTKFRKVRILELGLRKSKKFPIAVF